ncbi:MAG: sulfate permease [Aquificaceae bacterium]
MDRFLPFLRWFKGYDVSTFRKDFLAGLTVAVVLVPQSMAYAIIAGLPPVYGLYAASIPVIIAALFGSSPQLATGPVAIVAFLTYVSLSSFAKPGEEKFIELAIMTAMLVGIIQLLLGVFRLGFLVNFVSHAVIFGFTNAAAIIIATTQVPALLGIKVEQKELIFQNIYEIIKNLPKTNLLTVAIGITSIAMIVFLKRVNKNIPSPLIAVILFTSLSYWLSLENFGVRVVGQIPAGLPMPALPSVDLDLLDSLLGKATIIALIGFMEAYAIAKYISASTKDKISVNQELIGQGLANFVGSFFRSFPVSGSFSRSAVNFQSGAKTGMANVISASFVITTLFLAGPLLYYLPRAVLSAIVITAVISLVKPGHFLQIWRTNRNDGIVALSTFALSFIMKPDYAIFIGVFLSLSLFLLRSLYPKVSRLSKEPKKEVFVDADEYNLPVCPQITILRPEASIYYANAENIFSEIKNQLDSAKDTKYLVIDAESMNYLDATATDVLEDFLDSLRSRGVSLVFVNVKPQLGEVMKRSGILAKIGEKNFISSKGEAVRVLFEGIDHQYCKSVCPNAVFQECRSVKEVPEMKTAEISIKELFEELSERDVEVFLSKRYESIVIRRKGLELELRREDFHTDGKDFYLPSSINLKQNGSVTNLGKVCKENFRMINGFILLGEDIKTVSESISEIMNQ